MIFNRTFKFSLCIKTKIKKNYSKKKKEVTFVDFFLVCVQVVDFN